MKVDLDLKPLKGARLRYLGLSLLVSCSCLFKAFWLYGAVEPLTGESLFWQFSDVDTECYQQFLNEFAACYPKSLNVLQVDNGLFHKAKRLQIPENIVLLFQPAHSPELNPIERVWEHLKQDLKWELFDNLEHLRTKVAQLLAELTPKIAASLTGYDFILDALSVANIF
ncbi:transposase [Nostoc sp.]|uniref:transposase n=1 Tax=Nostoc sp. TaxID=1180 RepID=UPI002FF9CC0D